MALRKAIINLTNNILPLSALVLSIGLADAIEFKLNPAVHKFHNCPDIMQMEWSDYTAYHAFLSAIKCVWFMCRMLPIIPLTIVIPLDLEIIRWTSLANLLIPVLTWITRLDKSNMFLAHFLLYLVNPAGLMTSLMLGSEKIDK